MTDTVPASIPAADTLPAIKPERHIALEFLLHFCTFGIYTCFWCVTTTRDLKQAFNKHFTPWVWYFVPLFFLAQVIMFPRLLKAIEEAEKEQNITGWNEGIRRIWLILACGVGLLFTITRKIDISLGWVLLGLMIWAGCFAVLNQRMDKLRISVSNPRRKYYAGYAWWHWPLVVLGVPFMFFIVYSMVLTPYLAKVAPLATNTVISDERNTIQLTTLSSDWHKVEIGTFSDGSGLFEIAGPLDFQYFIAFDHDPDYSLTDLVQWRIGQNYDEFNVKACTEHRQFSEGTLRVESFVVCKGRSMGDPTVATHHFIRIEDRIYELYGYLSTMSLTYKEQEAGFLRQAQGLVPHEK